MIFTLQNIKLSSIKVDSKFTTTMQIVKLSGSHTISKIALKITDLKRAKMVSGDCLRMLKWLEIVGK